MGVLLLGGIVGEVEKMVSFFLLPRLSLNFLDDGFFMSIVEFSTMVLGMVQYLMDGNLYCFMESSDCGCQRNLLVSNVLFVLFL